MRRVLALAALASLAVVACTIVGGAAGALYAAAAALALLGLLLPPALKRQRSGRDGRRDSAQPAPESNTNDGAGTSRRLLPGVRRLPIVRELEADLAGERGENRALRERLRRELEAVQRANELLESERALHAKALRRVEEGVERHRRARSLLEREVEAIHALVTSRPTGPQRPAPAAANPAAAAQPLDGGLRRTQV